VVGCDSFWETKSPLLASPLGSGSSASLADDPAFEFFAVHVVSKSLGPIDGNDRNVILVNSQQLAVAFNINFLESIFVSTACGAHLPLRFIAEMTARACVQDHLVF
jgi:hypothetical protein